MPKVIKENERLPGLPKRTCKNHWSVYKDKDMNNRNIKQHIMYKLTIKQKHNETKQILYRASVCRGPLPLQPIKWSQDYLQKGLLMYSNQQHIKQWGGITNSVRKLHNSSEILCIQKSLYSVWKCVIYNVKVLQLTNQLLRLLTACHGHVDLMSRDLV